MSHSTINVLLYGKLKFGEMHKFHWKGYI